MENSLTENLKKRLSTKRRADKEWFLSLLDEEKQTACEEEHLKCVLAMLKTFYLARYRKRIAEAKEEIAELKAKQDYEAADYRSVLEKNAFIAEETKKMNAYKCFFAEPYFARMDVTDDREGYHVYYIGKKGDVNLEIVDWRAPLAVRYYQKSRIGFTINEYDYKTVLRRALSVKNGKLLEFRNEYLSVKDYLSAEEIAGRDEEILFDPFLRQIIKSRKDDTQIRDIIQTIQEKQFEIITLPERESFVLQGCAGSGKTMILLHRLSYLMYNNESLRPRDVLVVTPSDSFNAFIDELSAVLELQRVRTVTLQNYFLQVLKNEGVDLGGKIVPERENGAYLSYLYSDKFVKDEEKQIAKLYDGVRGMFAGEECREVATRIRDDCRRKRERFDRVKNASLRIRRAVLGEMKENGEGGFYFTKPFRTLMSAVAQAEDFLCFVLEERERTPDYFFRQFAEFYRCLQAIARHADEIMEQAREDLRKLTATVAEEIADLRRYRRKIGTEEVLTYADRIERRQELTAEAERISGFIADMEGGNELIRELYEIMRASKTCVHAGKCESAVDVARWLYRETVKKQKEKYGMKGVYPSDGYALCRVLASAGRKLSPRYGYVFVDEGQDISPCEYALLKEIHSDAAFNVFGDLKQNVTPYRDVKQWNRALPDATVYELDQNYRNTNEIVEYVSRIIDADMKPIGFHGEPVREIPPRGVTAFFRGKQGLRAIIAREEYLPLFEKRGYRRLSTDGTVSKTQINVMTVYESKGLEFSAVAVYDKDMTEHEKYIACTRALRDLAVITEG
ncbi:MAG: UvrD-helicase domain-containing protein [Candidatus Gallimonas sp.]